MPSIAPSAHTRRVGLTTDDWITPKWLLDTLGPFDLDPCASLTQPWPCAVKSYTVNDDGLTKPWGGGLVFLNPPYGRSARHWLKLMARHNYGIALVFARTETLMFHESVWPVASALLFLKGRINFHTPDGGHSKKSHNSGGPSVLIAYGAVADARLMRAAKKGIGHYTKNTRPHRATCGIMPSRRPG